MFFVNDLNGYYFSFIDSADTLAGAVRIADIFFRHASEGLYLHAASLKKNGKALLLPGNSGAGKSTITAWLTQNGFQYMSDEATFVRSGGHVCQGFTRPLHLKDEGLQLFKHLERVPKLPIRYSPSITFGYLVDISHLNPVEIGETSAIGAIIFPSYRKGAHLEYEKLSPGEATFALAQCLINARNLPKNGFPEMTRLSKSVPCWRLVYGCLDQLRRLMEEQNFLME